ncbi:hypothetical protein C1H46_008897 [Malus baccata]|uniref:Uncharacterized protein n=1 Tax=Malus baccata TaxID=106549 RepID=A0A540N356_MALBA|nr:hypothetical protein C1H46_008897 [Malus baccata]
MSQKMQITWALRRLINNLIILPNAASGYLGNARRHGGCSVSPDLKVHFLMKPLALTCTPRVEFKFLYSARN